MLVETYEVISHDPSRGDNALANELQSPEAIELITQLGLTGQEKLLNAGEPDAPVTRNPYRLMTAQEMAVYRELMPKQTKLAEYSDGPIPLRVLQVAAHAQDLCGELFIWHPEAGQDDPVLVGRIKSTKGYGYQFYLLARWGEVLQPFETLLQKAREGWIRKTKRDRENIIHGAQRDLATMEHLADEHFGDLTLAVAY